MPELPDRVRRRLDEVFGDVLPATTRDELAEATDEAGGPDPAEEDLRANRPPHHESRDVS